MAAKRGRKTGGGVGTNQYKIKGASAAAERAAPERTKRFQVPRKWPVEDYDEINAEIAQNWVTIQERLAETDPTLDLDRAMKDFADCGANDDDVLAALDAGIPPAEIVAWQGGNADDLIKIHKLGLTADAALSYRGEAEVEDIDQMVRLHKAGISGDRYDDYARNFRYRDHGTTDEVNAVLAVHAAFGGPESYENWCTGKACNGDPDHDVAIAAAFDTPQEATAWDEALGEANLDLREEGVYKVVAGYTSASVEVPGGEPWKMSPQQAADWMHTDYPPELAARLAHAGYQAPIRDGYNEPRVPGTEVHSRATPETLAMLQLANPRLSGRELVARAAGEGSLLDLLDAA